MGSSCRASRAGDTIEALVAHIGPALRRTEAISITAQGDSVKLRTTGGVHHGGHCIVCAGAGPDRLVWPLGLDVGQL